MNKLEISTHESLIIKTLLQYKFLTLLQLSKLLKLEITPSYLEMMQEKLMIKTLRHKHFSSDKEPLYFALPNKQLEIDESLYFQDIDLRKLSITEDDYFHIYHTVNYHILFNTYSEFRHITVNYFSAYFDAFKNKTKKDELEASGKYTLESGEFLIPNATMNFSLTSGEDFIYVLDLFSDTDVETIVKRIALYNQVFVENIYKLDRVILIFQNEEIKEKGIEYLINAKILNEYKKNFIFKTIENLENDFSLQWMSFDSKKEIPFIATQEKQEPDIEEVEVEVEVEGEVEEKEHIEAEIEDEILVEEKREIQDEIIVENTQAEEDIEEVIQALEPNLRTKVISLVQDSSLLLYTFAGVAAFVVSAYMEMIAFDSFYPGFFLISVVMVIAFEVAKVGSIFMKVYIKKSGSEVNKWTLKLLSSLFIPLLFGLSIISSMAVTADKLESPHAEELKAKSIKKIQTEYEEIVALTEKDHLRRTKQLKQDFFEKIAEFESRKKEVIANKDAEIEKQKTVYGADGKTWKGSKYEEHIKERKNLITEFAAERMRLEHLYNNQIEQESVQYRKEKKEDLSYKTKNLQSAESEVLADSWQAQNEMVRSFIKVVNHGFHLNLKELDFIFMLSILISILLELTIYKVFSNVAIVYAIRQDKK